MMMRARLMSWLSSYSYVYGLSIWFVKSQSNRVTEITTSKCQMVAEICLRPLYASHELHTCNPSTKVILNNSVRDDLINDLYFDCELASI
jgi:hypothetical protein